MFAKKPVRQLSPQEMQKALDQINSELKTDFTIDEAACQRKLNHQMFGKTLKHYPQNPPKQLVHYRQNPPAKPKERRKTF